MEKITSEEVLEHIRHIQAGDAGCRADISGYYQAYGSLRIAEALEKMSADKTTTAHVPLSPADRSALTTSGVANPGTTSQLESWGKPLRTDQRPPERLKS
jgi:hypothetical protein